MSSNSASWRRLIPWGLLGLAGLALLVRPAEAQRSRRALPPLSDFEVIEGKNLFHPDRTSKKGSDSKDPSRPGPADISGANFVLYGVVLFDNGKPIALLQEPKLTEKKVRSFVQGERIGPYLLKAVKTDRVVMAFEGEEFEVVLYKPKKSRPPPRVSPPKARTLPRPKARPPLPSPVPGATPPKLPLPRGAVSR